MLQLENTREKSANNKSGFGNKGFPLLGFFDITVTRIFTLCMCSIPQFNLVIYLRDSQTAKLVI